VIIAIPLRRVIRVLGAGETVGAQSLTETPPRFRPLRGGHEPGPWNLRLARPRAALWQRGELRRMRATARPPPADWRGGALPSRRAF